MAKIRAYKLAEELGIEKSELVEKAATLGIELKSAMAAVSEEDVETLRQRLGSAARSGATDDRRIERKGGTVIRRRRRKEPEPAPEPVAEPASVAEEAAAEPAMVAEAEAPVAELPDEPGVVEPSEEEDASAVEPAPAVDDGIAAVATPKTDDDAAGGNAAGTRAKPGAAQPASAERKGRQRKRVREVVNLQEQEQFGRQITNRSGPGRRVPAPARTQVNPRRKRRDALPKKAVAKPAAEQLRNIRVEGEISVGELAKQLGQKAAQIQGKLMALGIMVSVNQSVDVDTATKVATEFGFTVQDVGFKEAEFLAPAVPEVEGADVDSENLVTRPPIITVMGHVDHGKTSILDAIRKTAVVDGEAGGITQHIGAYQAEVRGSMLTFIDTPGHAAFTQMRARGAQVTDIVVLVVAATDGVMPQTIEAIDHAKAAGCPIVVAVNKCDLPDANPAQARQRLMEHDLVPEDFGGDVICVNVSAKTGEGLDQLLEMLALQAEVLELRADPGQRASGVVLEASLDKGRGPVATVLIQNGTLHGGDTIVADTAAGRVRVMEDDQGKRVKEAGPSAPVRVVGLSSVPEAGTGFHGVESERVAKQIVSHREGEERSKAPQPKVKLSLEDFFAQAEGEGPKELSIVLKADVQGTCEAVKDSLVKLSTDEVKLEVLSAGVGAISENDVMLASASGAIVVGFHVRPDPTARRQADAHGVDVRTYTIIMELLDEVRTAMAGLLPPTIKENMLGRAEVRETFTIPRIGTIAGSYITEGLVRRNANCRLVRDGVQIWEGTIGSLKRFKDDAREVATGFECGIGIAGYNDVKIGDVIEAYELEEHAAIL